MGAKILFILLALACCSLAFVSAADLKEALNKSPRVMVAPKDQNDLESLLRRFLFNFKVVTQDEALPLESRHKVKFRSIFQGISFTSYQRFNQINFHLDELVVKNSNRVKVDTIGYSFQGRQFKTITISNGDKKTNKNVIWVDGGIHAREWIAPAAALYAINQFVENFEANKDLLARYDWIVLPVVNPDGYEYTHTNSRTWRGTRKPYGNCIGTDANRNFDFHWGEVGTSSSPCSELFKIPSAFSEPETRAVRDQLLKLKGR